MSGAAGRRRYFKSLWEVLPLRQRLFALTLIPVIGLGWIFAEAYRPAASLRHVAAEAAVSADPEVLTDSDEVRATRQSRQAFLGLAVALFSLVVFVAMVIRAIESCIGGDPDEVADLVRSMRTGDLDTPAGEDVPSTGIPRHLLELREILKERNAAHEHTLRKFERLCAVLDCINTNVMICDMDMRVVHANGTVLQMFRRSESDIVKDFPDFRANEVVGRCVDDFHKAPHSQRFRISAIRQPFTSNISFGGENYKIIVNPIFSPAGERLGAAVEWENLTAQRLKEEEEKLRIQQIERMLDVLGNLRLTVTKEGEITDLNPSIARFLGYERENLLNASVEKILPRGFGANMISELARDGVFQDMRCMLQHADGQSLSVSLLGLAEFEDRRKRRLRQVMLLAKPSDPDTPFAESLQASGYVAERVSDGIAIVDGEWVVLSANSSFCDIINKALNQIIGANLQSIMPGAGVFAEESLQGRWEGEYERTCSDKTRFIVFMNVYSLAQNDRGGINRLVTIKDITSLKRSEQHIRNLAYKDTLTGLANRAYFEQRVSDSIKIACRLKQRLAILFFDLDGFKYVNDSFGHAAGDDMLQAVGERIKSEVRETDLVARLGGDEFCVLLEDIRCPDQASVVAEKCLNALTEPCVVSGRELQPLASVGITLYPDDGESYATLLQSADSAMYAAKQAGKNGYAYYSPELTIAARERLALEQELRRAVKNGDFELHYQPKIELASGRMVGVEALVRWKHAERGLVPPSEFIPVVERIGLVGDLGVWVLNEACRQAVAWIGAGLAGLKVAVNISGVHFLQGGIVESVRRGLAETSLEPNLLELEVTETAMQTDSEVLDTFNRLKDIGIGLSIDDFGKGFSCLNSIRQLPLDSLKIDRMFIRDLIHMPENSSIVATIIAMARAMGLTVVAEGVEELEQVQYLGGLGCDLAQGYYFSPPVAAGEIAPLATRSFYPSGSEADASETVSVSGCA